VQSRGRQHIISTDHFLSGVSSHTRSPKVNQTVKFADASR